jgi:hypothetical protein
MPDWEAHARLNAVRSQVARITAEIPAAERDALAAAQTRADSVAAFHNERVSWPVLGETSVEYRRRLLENFKSHSPQFKRSRFDSMDPATLGVVEDVVYADAVEAGKNRAAPGRLVEVKHRDAAGREITKYYGDISAFMAPFMRRGITGKFNPNAGK